MQFSVVCKRFRDSCGSESITYDTRKYYPLKGKRVSLKVNVVKNVANLFVFDVPTEVSVAINRDT